MHVFGVTFLPRDSRIWYRFLILLEYSHETEHILHLYFLSLSLLPLIFLLISFLSSFLFSYCICSVCFSIPSFSTPLQISWQSLQLAVQSICFHSLGQICFSGYLTHFHVVLHNVIKKCLGIMSAETGQTLSQPSSPPPCLSPMFAGLWCRGWLNVHSCI